MRLGQGVRYSDQEGNDDRSDRPPSPDEIPSRQWQEKDKRNHSAFKLDRGDIGSPDVTGQTRLIKGLEYKSVDNNKVNTIIKHVIDEKD